MQREIWFRYMCGTLCLFIMYINKTSIEFSLFAFKTIFFYFVCSLLTFNTRKFNKIQASFVDELTEGAICFLVKPQWRVKFNDVSCPQHHNSIAVEDCIESMSNSEDCAIWKLRSYCRLYEMIRSASGIKSEIKRREEENTLIIKSIFRKMKFLLWIDIGSRLVQN